MIKSYLAKKSAKKAAAATLKKQINVALILGATALIREGLHKLEEKKTDWTFLGYRRYIGL